ncbi:FkbM family methyltransferase [Mesorhizobium sp.]|uniref:FkbM family methyltransferase n=1 Tax=Mesorhizobium sp. TaxID=1871066 RepID=UPI0025F852C7|nr:FkbM family methyltransferase [Mesorhizobium sp.]
MNTMKHAFHLVNVLGNIVPHAGRRFLLDRLGLGKILQRASKGSIDQVKLPNGYDLFFNPMLHWNATNPKNHEPEVTALLHRYLKPGAIFYDIGANIGLHSLIASKIVGPTGRVLAFEPGEINLKYFRRTLENRIPNVSLHEFAIGAADEVRVFDLRGGAMSGKLVGPGENAVAPVSVQVRCIDSLIAEGYPRPDVIKIDIEGGEADALQGAATTLQTHPVVICEMHDFAPDEVKRAMKSLTEAGYQVTRIPDRSPSDHSRSHHIVAVRGDGV